MVTDFPESAAFCGLISGSFDCRALLPSPASIPPQLMPLPNTPPATQLPPTIATASITDGTRMSPTGMTPRLFQYPANIVTIRATTAMTTAEQRRLNPMTNTPQNITKQTDKKLRDAHRNRAANDFNCFNYSFGNA
jgi:hypothetical protein